MIYTFFMKKFQKDKAPFPTTMVVKKYLDLYGQNDIVISFPGYMGYDTNTIDDFIKGMSFPTNTTYFTIGMNGNRICQCDMNSGGINQCRINSKMICHCGNNSSKICIYGKTVQDYHNAHFNKFGNINNALKDHSKMLFFLDPHSVNGELFKQNKEDMELEDAQLLLKSCNVKAVLIGSSNQSYNTYFKDPADKGEADVFMIKNSALVKEEDRIAISLNEEFYDEKAKEFYDKITNYNETNENKLKNENHIILSKMLRGGEGDFLGKMLHASLTTQ